MGYAFDERITASDICGLVATWFCIIGLPNVNIALEPSNKVTRLMIMVRFERILTALGVVHSAFHAIVTTTKLSIENRFDIYEVVLLSQHINNVLRLLVYPIFGVLSLVFIGVVWKKHTLYPRLIISCFPLLLFLLESAIKTALPQNL